MSRSQNRSTRPQRPEAHTRLTHRAFFAYGLPFARYPASYVLPLVAPDSSLTYAGRLFAFIWIEFEMSADGNGIVRGLFLDFPALRACAERLKTLGIRLADTSVLLPDGSVVTATAVEFLRTQSVRAKALSNDAARPQNSASALAKALLSLGIPAYISEGLECRIRNGGILLSVRCNASVAENVEGIFIESGAEDVSSASAKRIEVLPREGPRKQPYNPQPVPVWRERAASA